MAERTITLTLTPSEEVALSRALGQLSRMIVTGKQPLIDKGDYEALGRVSAALNAVR